MHHIIQVYHKGDIYYFHPTGWTRMESEAYRFNRFANASTFVHTQTTVWLAEGKAPFEMEILRVDSEFHSIVVANMVVERS